MKQQNDVKDKERRTQKIVEKQNLEKRKAIHDRHYHLLEDDDEDDEIQSRYGYLIKGKK